MNPVVPAHQIYAMLHACVPGIEIREHSSGHIAQQDGLDFPFLPPLGGAMVPLGTVELLIRTFGIDRDCARGEVPMLDPN